MRRPAEVGCVEKWQPAFDLIDETRSWGIEVPQVITDGGQGDTAAFRHRLETRKLHHMVAIPTTTTTHLTETAPA
ncbi:transposase [Streptomyces profundus]|uniref:transposase n=1 Tax=Streptomyces profundus TaxID=2867410 RepID=UPI001D163B5B|nr:transposase [Streptomyces sp. MA3_2.13]